MTKDQINRLEMMKTTDDYLNANAAIWSAVPMIATYKTQLSQLIDGIRTTAQAQEAAQVFIGSTLQQLKLTVAEKMDILDDVLEAYADDTDNAELMAKAANSKTDYLRLPHEEFETKVKNVVQLLEANVAQMADYGLTQDQIDDAKLTFDQFQDKRGLPRTFRVSSRVATGSLENQYKESLAVLDRLDRVMKRFKRSNATFYNGYTASRMIVNG